LMLMIMLMLMMMRLMMVVVRSKSGAHGKSMQETIASGTPRQLCQLCRSSQFKLPLREKNQQSSIFAGPG